MEYATIADIYSANENARKNLEDLISGISDEEAAVLPNGETWTIQKIVEHLSMVDFGISRICAKLLNDARASGRLSDGSVELSPEFLEKLATVSSAKVEAPESVQPTGTVSMAEALEKMKANRPAIEAMRMDLEKYDLSASKFPHPYFGDITAAEWLIVAGGHEQRHAAQIEKLLVKIRQ